MLAIYRRYHITSQLQPLSHLRHRPLAHFPLRRFVSAEPQRSRTVRRITQLARFSGYFLISSTFGVLAIGAGIFIHDAFTYTERHIDRVPISPLALHPEHGGPKNLPIARVQVDDEEDEENIKLAGKPRLVIVGGGWGVRLTFFISFLSDKHWWQAVSLLQSLDSGSYHVTVITPETFTTFTPLLPCEYRCAFSPSPCHNIYFIAAAVGTVQIRSLVEPIRKIIARLRGHFVQGKAVDICMSERLLEVETISANGTQNVY